MRKSKSSRLPSAHRRTPLARSPRSTPKRGRLSKSRWLVVRCSLSRSPLPSSILGRGRNVEVSQCYKNGNCEIWFPTPEWFLNLPNSRQMPKNRNCELQFLWNRLISMRDTIQGQGQGGACCLARREINLILCARRPTGWSVACSPIVFQHRMNYTAKDTDTTTAHRV